jgi:hypothetical protein
MRWPPFLFLGVVLCAAPPAGTLSAPEQAAVESISAQSMRGNLSFLSSDALEGRATPSRGLDIAAEFIASCFRRAGLQPLAPNYFQMADTVTITPKLDDFRLTLTDAEGELRLTLADVEVRSLRGFDAENAPVTTLRTAGARADIAGKVVAAEARGYPTDASLGPLRARKPALILLVSPSGRPDAETAWKGEVSGVAEAGAIPVIRIFNEDAAAALEENRPTAVSLHLAPPARSEVKVANVVGLLPGSDPALGAQYVVVSAHYDHLGIKNGRIYNGANDDGSGVVSMIEMANALAVLQTKPRRGIVFAAFFGEEDGLLGSQYYAHHPLEPLRATVANINLEQMGRTDEQDGPEVGAFAFTGPSFSNLPANMTAAARAQGVKVYNKRGADSFFDRSDNFSLAEAGVVAHTVVVAFEYPDYHAPGDKWEKIDYSNMAKVDRAVAAGILQIADAPEPPKWSDTPQTAAWRRAGR